MTPELESLGNPYKSGLGEPGLRHLYRARLLEALATVIHRQGFAQASVSAVCAEAKVSRRTFYQEFDSLDHCLLALFEEGTLRVNRLIFEAFDGARDWRQGVRDALASLLLFFDANPHFAWAWLIESTAAGQVALRYRERNVTALTSEILERWSPPPGAESHPLAPLSVMASILAAIQKHLLAHRPEPLISLLGPLMGIVTAPYLTSEQVAAEVERGDRLGEQAARTATANPAEPNDGSDEIPDLLLNPRAHRARGVIVYLSGHPGASNRQIADAVGVRSHTQISTLLSRLAAHGLLKKCAGLPGRENEWALTDHGGVVCTILSNS